MNSTVQVCRWDADIHRGTQLCSTLRIPNCCEPFSTTSVGLYVRTARRRIVFWNDGAEKITGYMRHTVLGHICGESQPPRPQRKVCPFCGTCKLTKKRWSMDVSVDAQIYLEHKAGYMIPVHARAVPVRNAQGVVAGISADL